MTLYYLEYMDANFNLDYRHNELDFELPRLKLAELPTPLTLFELLTFSILTLSDTFKL